MLLPRCRGQPFKCCIPKRKQMTPSNPLCNFFPAISPFGSQFTLPAAPSLTRPWRPASAQLFAAAEAAAAATIYGCSVVQAVGGGGESQREALPGLRHSLDRPCASRRVSSCKPFGRQAELSVAQSSSSLRSFEPSSVLSFSREPARPSRPSSLSVATPEPPLPAAASQGE